MNSKMSPRVGIPVESICPSGFTISLFGSFLFFSVIKARFPMAMPPLGTQIRVPRKHSSCCPSGHAEPLLHTGKSSARTVKHLTQQRRRSAPCFTRIFPVLIPKIVAHKLDMNPVLDHVSFNDTPHIADALGRFAVRTQSGFHTRGVNADSRVTAFGNWPAA